MLAVLRSPLAPPDRPPREVERRLGLRSLNGSAKRLTGGSRPDRDVRRCGKMHLQAQLMRPRRAGAFYCNFEDTRLYRRWDRRIFPTFLSVLDELVGPGASRCFWMKCRRWGNGSGWCGPCWIAAGRSASPVRTRRCWAGNWGAKLTGRQSRRSRCFRSVTLSIWPSPGKIAGVDSLPGLSGRGRVSGVTCSERRDLVLQELLRDVVQRDVAARHGLRETRHVMNLLLFLLANTGQPLSFQTLTKNLAVPTVGQTSRYLEFLQDAYLLFAVPKFSASFKQRVVAPAKYYAIDNGLRQANSPQLQPDLGHRLENAGGTASPPRLARTALRQRTRPVGMRFHHPGRGHPGLPRTHPGQSRTRAAGGHRGHAPARPAPRGGGDARPVRSPARGRGGDRSGARLALAGVTSGCAP
ncbi:MAG: hypothetical protein M0C28_06620 [Candidatus Moduliflexus flocculans]|nr:hypothetical protein [Candidatus Moduliflexus flocculans]